VESDYAAAYPELYQRHWWWRAREEFLVSILRRYLQTGAAQRILDVGCGSGLFFDRLSEFGVVQGVETDNSMRTGRVADDLIHWGPLETFRPLHSFTAILFLDVLEHLAAPVEALRRALELLGPGGLVFATVPAFPLLWTRHDELNHHLTRNTKRSFAEVVAQAGGQVTRLHYFFHWTFPVKLGVRLVEYLNPRAKTTLVPSIPPKPLNKVLYWTSRMEQMCHAERVVPFGSSLLCIATRIQ
jgi:SAM-dependent methyltransferase